MHDQGVSLMGLKIPETEKNPMTICIIVKLCYTGTRLIRTPHYCGEFALSLRKESTYIFSKLNPLNTESSLLQAVCFVPGERKLFHFL